MCNLDDPKTIFSRCGKRNKLRRDGVVETTKTSLPCFPALEQSVSWIFRANSVPFGILLSRIPRK